MKNRSYFSVIALLIIFWGTICPISADAKGKDKRAGQSLKKYYDNDEKFQKLSGAAQSTLEQLYGPKSTKTRTQTRQVSRTSHKVLNAQAGPETLPANVPVNNPALDTTNQVTQSESCIVLGSTSNNVIVSFNDSGECTGACATEQHFTGFGYSTDGGTVFIDGGALPDDPVGSMGDAGQPVLGRDATNNIIHLVTAGMDFTTGNGPSLKCFRSMDNGATWSTSVDCTPGMAADDFQDKPWLAVDNFAGPGQSNVYIAWRQFAASDADPQGIRFIRSTDGGLTWVDQELIAEEGAHNVQGAFVAVGPDHSVYVFWLDQSAGVGTHHQLRGRKSTDQGVTFGAAADIFGPYINEDTNGDLALSNGFRSNGYPHAVVVPAGASMNDIEITFADFDPLDGDPDIFRITCNNGNLSICTPRAQVNTDTDDAEQFMPTVAVTPDGGNLLFAWYDMRNDSGLIERFGKIWIGASPTPDFRISDNPFPPVFGLDPVVNSVLASDYLVDYDCAVADNSFFYTSFLDTEQGTPDVVFAKIPPNGPGGILRTGNHVISGGNGNGHIEFNECNDLTIQLRNEGTASVTSISAVLSTNTPNVTITQNSSSYPDLAPGATADNNTPFEISTSQAFACGTSIDLTLTVTSSDGTNVFNLSLDTSEGYPFT
ncbi:glycoside hydrolase, partial [bacterium]|nr:glycoside hydrolase [bacterium]